MLCYTLVKTHSLTTPLRAWVLRSPRLKATLPASARSRKRSTIGGGSATIEVISACGACSVRAPVMFCNSPVKMERRFNDRYKERAHWLERRETLQRATEAAEIWDAQSGRGAVSEAWKFISASVRFTPTLGFGVTASAAVLVAGSSSSTRTLR